MSPLIDVTNTAGQEILPNSQHSHTRRRRARTSRSCPRIPNTQGQVEFDITGSHIIKRRSEPVIKMCNTQVSEQASSSSPDQGLTTNPPCMHPKKQATAPLPSQTTDILLSQAVQTLSLSQSSALPSLQTQRHVNKHLKKNVECAPENKCKTKNKVLASCSGLPDTPGTCESDTSPQQCGACGLEFTSLPVLTQHLARHVYDGLYAAQWLTQAMRLVVSRQPAGEPFTRDDNGDDYEFVRQHPSVD